MDTTTSVNITLTKEERKFLSEFASKQYEGAKDNVGTREPIHVVERECKEFIADNSDEIFLLDAASIEMYVGTEIVSFESFDDMVQYINETTGKDLPSYDDVEYSEQNGIKIYTHQDYAQAYDIDFLSGHNIISYEPVAYFFILDEAKRYKNDYQKHNCNNCRIHTRGLGYSNYGDFPVFRNLLMKLGNQLLEENKNE